MEANYDPKTLQEAVLFFADPANCREYMIARRWPKGVTCPRCGSKNVLFMEKYNRWHCREKHEAPQFTLKTGTVYEDSPISLDKWLMVTWMVTNCKNGVSSYEIHRAVKVTQKSAWFMLHRVRLAMQTPNAAKLAGTIEADETFIGGKMANMHLDKQTRMRMGKKRVGGFEGKAVVMGLLERETGKALVKTLPNTRAFHVRSNVIANVKKGSTVYSDSLRSYRNLPVDGFVHQFVDHTERYVMRQVHTNGLENFWSLFKRMLKGTYVSVEPFHLQAYSDEQCFRFNERKSDNADRFSKVVEGIVGKRITYKELTGKDTQEPERES